MVEEKIKRKNSDTTKTVDYEEQRHIFIVTIKKKKKRGEEKRAGEGRGGEGE